MRENGGQYILLMEDSQVSESVVDACSFALAVAPCAGVAQSVMALPAIDHCSATTIKKRSLKLKKIAKRSSEL